MNPRKTLTIILLVAGCLAPNLATWGCRSKDVNDRALLTDIQAKLYNDPTARGANVKVSVANGVATLTGDVPSSDVALKVVDLANGTSGVKRVDNQLTVTAPGTSADTTGTPANPAQAPPAVGVPPAGPVTATVPAGTDMEVQMIDGISSQKSKTGQTFRASLSSPVIVNGRRVLPAGAGATILLAEAKGAGRIKGSSELEVRLVSIKHAGQTYRVDSNVHEVVGKGRGEQSAVRTGVGAAAGALIGAIAGGGKGAAIGSLAGGGAGAGFQLATHGQQVNIPSETQLTFTVQSPIVVTLHREHDERGGPQ